jgi:hypothetical protein
MKQKKQKSCVSQDCVWRSRNTAFFCCNDTSLPSSLCSTLFAAIYKVPAEGRLGAFAFCLCLLLWALDGFLLWAFWCGKLLKGKRIPKGKLLKRKYDLQGVDRKSAQRTLTQVLGKLI